MPPSVASRLRPSSRTFDNKVLPWLLLAPALLVVFGLVVYPVGRTVWLSFRSAGLPYLASGESRFVGLENYRHLLTDAHLREVFLTTAGFGFACSRRQRPARRRAPGGPGTPDRSTVRRR